MDRSRGTRTLAAGIVGVVAVVGCIALVATWLDDRTGVGPSTHRSVDLAQPERAWTQFSDLVTVGDGGPPVVVSLKAGPGRSAKLAAAIVAAGTMDSEPLALATATLRSQLDSEVAQAISGDRAAMTALARILVLQRRDEIAALSDDDIDALAGALVSEGSPNPWSGEVASSYWLRSELAHLLFSRGEMERADQLALLDPAFVCGLASLAATRPSDVALVVSYQRVRSPAPCIDEALPVARDAALRSIDPGAVHIADQLGADDPAFRSALATWMNVQLEAGVALAPDALVGLTTAAVLSDVEPPPALRSAAQRSVRVLASAPDSVSGQPSFDAYLFMELDQAVGREPWTPAISTDEQLAVFGGDWASLLAAETGAASSEEIRRACGAAGEDSETDSAADQASPGGLPPFALLGRLAIVASETQCGDVEPDGVASQVAQSQLIAPQLGGRTAAWAAAYIGCRYVTSPAQEAGLRDRAASMSWDAPLAWEIEVNPEDYYAMFDAYSLAWLHQFVTERVSCDDLTIWSQSTT